MGERHQYILFKGKSADEVVGVLARCAELTGKTLKEGRPRDRFEPVLAVAEDGTCGAVRLHKWSKLCWRLNEVVEGCWISIRAQEGDHWDYTLYRGKDVIDQFSARPNYWDSDDARDPKYDHKKGKPEVLAQAWEIPIERVEKYLVSWDLHPELDRQKAYPDDESPYGSVFQGDTFAVALGYRFHKDRIRLFYADPGENGEWKLHPNEFPALNAKDLEETLQRWLEPHRAWHKRSHLIDLLCRMSGPNLTKSDVEMLGYVALFHDAIYQPLSATNEEDSARLAEKYLANYPRRNEVVRLILATKHHKIAELPPPKSMWERFLKFLGSRKRRREEELTRMFNDWDCSILKNNSWEEIQWYEEDIAFEYQMVDRETYRKERGRFLRNAAKENQNPLLERLANEVDPR